MSKTKVYTNAESYVFYVSRRSNWGNPWCFKGEKIDNSKGVNHFLGENFDQKKFTVDTIEEAADNYRKWLLGEDFKDLFQHKRAWILNFIKNINSKTILCDYLEYGKVLAEIAKRNDIEIPPLPKIELPEENIKNKKLKKRKVF